MPLAAGFVGILPALGLLEEEKDGSPPIHLSWLAAVGWSCSVAFFGVFLSPPIRKQVVRTAALVSLKTSLTLERLSKSNWHFPPVQRPLS